MLSKAGRVGPEEGVNSVMKRAAVAGPAVLIARGLIGVGRMVGKGISR